METVSKHFCIFTVMHQKVENSIPMLRTNPLCLLALHWNIDIEFIWIRAAMRSPVITVNCFSAYTNRKAFQNALLAICKSSLLTALCNAQCKATPTL